jgi:hypothetical protein
VSPECVLERYLAIPYDNTHWSRVECHTLAAQLWRTTPSCFCKALLVDPDWCTLDIGRIAQLIKERPPQSTPIGTRWQKEHP